MKRLSPNTGHTVPSMINILTRGSEINEVIGMALIIGDGKVSLEGEFRSNAERCAADSIAQVLYGFDDAGIYDDVLINFVNEIEFNVFLVIGQGLKSKFNIKGRDEAIKQIKLGNLDGAAVREFHTNVHDYVTGTMANRTFQEVMDELKSHLK